MTDSTLKLGIPRTLDSPPKLLWWDADQAILVSGCLVFGMAIGSPVIGVLLGGGIGVVYGRAKSGKHPMFAFHIMYWYLPGALLGLKRTPSSDYREYVG